MELSDIPKPHIRFYDDKRRKRKLHVEITSWQGISIGAKHFYAEVYEDGNPVLYNGQRIGNSEDKDYKGKSFGAVMDPESSFKTLDGAIAWAINTILKEFPNHMLDKVSGSYVSFNRFKKILKEAKKDENKIRTN